MKDDIFNMIDVLDFPKELLKEMQMSDKKIRDLQLLQLFKIANRPLNLSELLIAHYRSTGEIIKRSAMISLMYRFCKKGLIKNTALQGQYELVLKKLEGE